MKKNFTLKDKLVKGMKICSLQVAIAFVLCTFVFAHDDKAQVLDKKLTVTLKEVSIEEALTTIERLTNVKFFYSVDQLGVTESISYHAIDQSLGKILDELLRPYRIKYKVHEKSATITLKKQAGDPKAELATGSLEHLVVADPSQMALITGTVTDANTEQPMAGVNIIEKGTTNGTATDAEGKYTLRTQQENAALLFSFIGYKTREVAVGERSVIDISLEEDLASLKPVVVNAGYWEVSEKESTGNIAKVTADEIARQSVTNPLAALQGRMPGVVITQNSGIPGSGFTIRIRGENSIRTKEGANDIDPNEPLYLIDGVPFPSNSLVQTGTILNSSSPLNSINPADIESIVILKDADATAIYGSRGANGIVLITTKKATAGKTKVEVNVSTGIGKNAAKLDLLNTEQYLQMRNEAFANDGVVPTTSNAPDLTLWDQSRYTDWQKTLLGGTAHYTDAKTSFSGGNANTQFLFSGDYWRETSVFPGDNAFGRASGHISVKHNDDSGKFAIALVANYTISNNNLPNDDLTSSARTLPPNAPPLLDENGNLNWEQNTSGASTWTNPLSYLRNPYEARVKNLSSDLVLSYAPVSWLKIKSTLGYVDIRNEEKVKNFASQLGPDNSLTGIQIGSGSAETWIAEPQIEYNQKLAGGQLSILLGSTFQESVQENERILASGFSSEALIDNLAAADNVRVTNSGFSQYKYNAFFARVHYNWKDKYLVNLTGRRDGSSRFGPGKRFANFGAVGIGWIFTNEPFIRNGLQFLSFGKLRTSYGVTGSDNIGEYRYLDSYEPTNFPYVTGGLLPVRLANRDYHWEQNKKYEAAVDLGFVQDRIRISASWFRNRSSDQLLEQPLPATAGSFGSIQVNLPATMQNEGWEFELHTINLVHEKLSWNSSLNVTIPDSKLLEFPYLDELSAYNLRFVIGEPTTIVRRYHSLGVSAEAGDYQFVDANEDESFTNDDRNTIVDLGPRFYGGISNTLQYGNVSLSFFFEFRYQDGNDLFNSFPMPGTQSNQPDDVLSRWQAPGDGAKYMKFSRGSSVNYNRWRLSDDITTNISFLRLQNVSFSYDIPVKWRDKLKMQQCRIYIQGQNLLHFGPEKRNILSLPPLRIITAGLQMTI